MAACLPGLESQGPGGFEVRKNDQGTWQLQFDRRANSELWLDFPAATVVEDGQILHGPLHAELIEARNRVAFEIGNLLAGQYIE